MKRAIVCACIVGIAAVLVCSRILAPRYVTVDNFESYTNESPKRVCQTWMDGMGFSPDEFFSSGDRGNGSGAMVGYDPMLGDMMETRIVHGGRRRNSGDVYEQAVVKTVAGFFAGIPNIYSASPIRGAR